MIRVKICGITNVADALQAVEAGADALGFIFVPRTPRYVEPVVAAAIIRMLPPFVLPVGVFWDHAPEEVRAIHEACGFGALQFHGNEPPEYVAQFRQRVIKAVKVKDEASLRVLAEYKVSAFLLDSPARWSEGEPRPAFSWELARTVAQGHRVILSGGLTPETVAAALRLVKPYGVDVNSGVEATPGRKDPERVRAFIEEAKRYA
jgi:phosphoribosylanthranilate isomerase